MRKPEIAKNPSTPTEDRSWRIATDDTPRPVRGKECHRITDAASANLNAFNALLRGSNASPTFIGPPLVRTSRIDARIYSATVNSWFRDPPTSTRRLLWRHNYVVRCAYPSSN